MYFSDCGIKSSSRSLRLLEESLLVDLEKIKWQKFFKTFNFSPNKQKKKGEKRQEHRENRGNENSWIPSLSWGTALQYKQGLPT